jgi:hypothetical protein
MNTATRSRYKLTGGSRCGWYMDTRMEPHRNCNPLLRPLEVRARIGPCIMVGSHAGKKGVDSLVLGALPPIDATWQPCALHVGALLRTRAQLMNPIS